MKIPFNKPYLTGNELNYIEQVVEIGKISGDGHYTQKCHKYFGHQFGFQKCLLTTSCTDALEMSALLIGINPGDEVIVPSFTFVSSAVAFVRQGAKIIFCDSKKSEPCMDEATIESLITPRTKAIVVVHYAGIACDMDVLKSLSDKYNLYLIEDAAQAIDSTYKGKPLGGIGHLGCFSFHETKNIQCGEGGMLVINDNKFNKRAEIIWEKGTNRAEFFRGEIDKYGWVDIGSSFLPSEITSAFLFAQLENLENIQESRLKIWKMYYKGLSDLAEKGLFQLPIIPSFAKNNAHMFYIICRTGNERSLLIDYLKSCNISAVFHYQSLHQSDYYLKNNHKVHLPNSDKYSSRLLRLPLFYELSEKSTHSIIQSIISFFKK